MARVTVILNFPTLTVADLVALVVANDDADSAVNGEPGIDPEFVRGDHVVSLWSSGELPMVDVLVEASMTD